MGVFATWVFEGFTLVLKFKAISVFIGFAFLLDILFEYLYVRLRVSILLILEESRFIFFKIHFLLQKKVLILSQDFIKI
jgi:hypothetical protein